MTITVIPQSYMRLLDKLLIKLLRGLFPHSKLLRGKKYLAGIEETKEFNRIQKQLAKELREAGKVKRQVSLKSPLQKQDYWKYKTLLKAHKSGQLSDTYFDALINNPHLIDEYTKRMNYISAKMVNGRIPTHKEQELIELHGYFMLAGSKSRIYKPINSSWLESVRYDSLKKIMSIKIQEYGKICKFYNVPIWVYQYLVSVNMNAGTDFWRNNFGLKYSTNPQHWMRKGYNYIDNRAKRISSVVIDKKLRKKRKISVGTATTLSGLKVKQTMSHIEYATVSRTYKINAYRGIKTNPNELGLNRKKRKK